MTAVKRFLNGRSQAVRLPKAFRFESVTEVFIAGDSNRVILSPARRPSIERLIDALGQFESVPDRQQPALDDMRGAL